MGTIPEFPKYFSSIRPELLALDSQSLSVLKQTPLSSSEDGFIQVPFLNPQKGKTAKESYLPEDTKRKNLLFAVAIYAITHDNEGRLICLTNPFKILCRPPKEQKLHDSIANAKKKDQVESVLPFKKAKLEVGSLLSPMLPHPSLNVLTQPKKTSPKNLAGLLNSPSPHSPPKLIEPDLTQPYTQLHILSCIKACSIEPSLDHPKVFTQPKLSLPPVTNHLKPILKVPQYVSNDLCCFESQKGSFSRYF